jgi:hypothetical protein
MAQHTRAALARIEMMMTPALIRRPEPSFARAAAVVVLGLVLAVGAAGCVTSPDDTGDDLAANRRKWQSQGIRDYSVRYRLICFCVTSATDPVLLQVRNGALVSVTRVADGTPVDPSRWAGIYYTVDELFALLTQAQAQGPNQLRVSYDPALGYPTEVYLDERAAIADDERSYEMSGLVPR